MHHLIINSSDSIFTLHIYVPEEFLLKNNTLIIPTKPKIDIEINNFPFLNGSSKLALYVSLESKTTYNEYDDTEDEELGYASNEKAVSTINNTFTGIFSWSQSAIIDEISNIVNASALDTDDYDNNYQKMYLIYPQGINISHDLKIGLEGIFRINVGQFPWHLLTIFLAIGAISISVAVPVYYYFNNKRGSPVDEDYEQNKKMKGIIELKAGEITAFTEDFYASVEKFEWDVDEKEEFIREMSSLTPKERKRIIKEMLDKYRLDKDY